MLSLKRFKKKAVKEGAETPPSPLAAVHEKLDAMSPEELAAWRKEKIEHNYRADKCEECGTTPGEYELIDGSTRMIYVSPVSVCGQPHRWLCSHCQQALHGKPLPAKRVVAKRKALKLRGRKRG